MTHNQVAEKIANDTDNAWGWANAVQNSWSTYTHGERVLLAEAALSCVDDNGLILEIGCYGGRSLRALLYVARERHARVIGIDPFFWDGDKAEPELRKALCDFPDVAWRFYPMTSEDAHMVLKNTIGTIDFLHIDGDHDHVDKDCNLWLQHLRQGGLVAFHDARDDVEQAFDKGELYRQAGLFTGTWPLYAHRREDNFLLIRRKPCIFEEAFVLTDTIRGGFDRPCAELYWQQAIATKGTMLEIGVGYGRSSSLLLQAARETGSDVILVDIWQDGEGTYEPALKLRELFADVPVTMLRMSSQNAATIVFGPLALVYIDGGHYEPNPEIDCSLWLPKLVSGGIACFHDYGVEYTAVTEAVDRHAQGWERIGNAATLEVRRKP